MENLPQGFTPGTDVRLAEADVLVYVGDNQLQPQPGTLFVKLSQVAWWSDETQRGVCISYPNIMIHAISRDPSAFHMPCIYMQLDTGEGDCDTETPGELRLVPRDPANLDKIFAALSECQALHPDPEDQDSEGEMVFEGDMDVREDGHPSNGVHNHEGPDAFDDDDELDENGLNAQGRAVLARIEANFPDMPEDHVEGQFDDADEEH